MNFCFCYDLRLGSEVHSKGRHCILMTDASLGEVTVLLNQAGAGDPSAFDKLTQLTYEELHQVAQRLMQHEGQHTLQPTALLNEAFQKLLQDDLISKSPNRAYFFGAVAQSMRRILVDAARTRNAQKRGGDLQRQPVDRLLDYYQERSLDLVALDEALQELQKLHPRQHEVINLRWFAGMTVEEVAELQQVSISTVEADWRLARAFLRLRVSNEE